MYLIRQSLLVKDLCTLIGAKRDSQSKLEFCCKEQIQVSSILLVSAVLASLASGVLISYGLCYGMFFVFRIHSIQVAQQRAAAKVAAPATTATPIEG